MFGFSCLRICLCILISDHSIARSFVNYLALQSLFVESFHGLCELYKLLCISCVNLRKKSSVKKSAAKGFKKGVSKTKKEHKKRREQKKYIKSLVHKAVKSSSQDRSSHHGSTEGKSGMSTSRSRKSDSEVNSSDSLYQKRTRG